MVRHFTVLHFPDPAIPCEVVRHFPLLYFQFVHFQSPLQDIRAVCRVSIRLFLATNYSYEVSYSIRGHHTHWKAFSASSGHFPFVVVQCPSLHPQNNRILFPICSIFIPLDGGVGYSRRRQSCSTLCPVSYNSRFVRHGIYTVSQKNKTHNSCP